MYAYLTITAGQRAGSNIVLDPAVETRLGRGPECTVVLADSLCSRVHAAISYGDGGWSIRDAGSRNGTYVNQVRTAHAILEEGHIIRLGSTELVFHTSDQPPTVGGESGLQAAPTFILGTPLEALDSDPIAQGLARDGEQAQDLLLLYNYCQRLWSCRDPCELMRTAVELLQQRTRAATAAFLLTDATGRLRPRWVIPQPPTRAIELSDSLTRLVVGEGHAVWMAAQEARDASLQHESDALCVPLVWQRSVLGALHITLDHGRFRPSHFDFAISLARIVAPALARLRQQHAAAAELARLHACLPESEPPIIFNPGMQALWEQAQNVAAQQCALLQGECGTGKEYLARWMHRRGSAGPLVVFHCAAMPPREVESRLFGHAAADCSLPDCDHGGLVVQAADGSLILKEVAALPHSAQTKLLRLLEGLPLIHPADGTEMLARPRIFATSRQALASYVHSGVFREDLYQRLSMLTLDVPPLRERPEDIEPLAMYFLEAYAALHGRRALDISAEARSRLRQYDWPGNVRQLRGVVELAVSMAAGPRIEVADLHLPGTAPHAPSSLCIEDWERRLIAEALARTAGNVPQAAKLLGIGRATLYRKCEQYGIQRGDN